MNTRPLLCLVTPALADANNGNWQTAQRWARLLSTHYRVRLAKTWTGASAEDRSDQGLLALHARRSADAVAAWAQLRPGQPLALALTGTDLYRDIQTDASAQRSIRLASALIVLQDLGPLALPAELRSRCHVVLQSSTRRKTLPKTTAHLRALMVGHLREEKSPETFFEAARLLRPDEGIWLDHIGRGLDPVLAQAAQATMDACTHYRWLGGLPHTTTRERIQRAHLLVHASRMEGGAHVIMEAALSGTPVLASRIDGNVGMLGADYAGYFEPGNAQGLASLLRICRMGINQPDGLLAQLHSQSVQRAKLFEPSAEQAALVRALAGLPWPSGPRM
ncbi:selenoneine biosynthesis selenosugar synthase SenB [Hydrogenophaga sp. PAMC20947]|uniref:selenoneine biosynthesis selenosugar synthase SenB n=1 Tax=Hydrogenophaga sp. PAMC20947 TaxID=2565558 RepID=UPI00109D842D|nr:selenoneine biosynthesis selenosugar synthase SenB [Hydrogenophaga sp. PAMC20947]QCB46603.1 TIGR04348 family glycosyltransferase [Hydrogenophaga sp. PAMC20947]